jgi:hypothetical protein
LIASTPTVGDRYRKSNNIVRKSSRLINISLL